MARRRSREEEHTVQDGRKLLSPFRVAMRIRIRRDDEIVIGTTLAGLLRYVDEFGSVHEASEEMRINYEDAVDLIQGAEAGLDMTLLMRKESKSQGRNRGGNAPGPTALTPFAKKLVEEYAIFELELVTEAERRVRDMFIYLKDSVNAEEV